MERISSLGIDIHFVLFRIGESCDGSAPLHSIWYRAWQFWNWIVRFVASIRFVFLFISCLNFPIDDCACLFVHSMLSSNISEIFGILCCFARKMRFSKLVLAPLTLYRQPTSSNIFGKIFKNELTILIKNLIVNEIFNENANLGIFLIWGIILEV